MRADEFVKKTDLIPFIQFLLDKTWTQIEKKQKKAKTRQEGKRGAALASRQAAIVKRNRSTQSASQKSRNDPSLRSTGRPTRNDS